MTGAPNVSSSACSTCGGSEAEDERMNRSLALRTISPLRAARARIAWCIVGTAVYQLGSTSCSQPKNFSALKPGVQDTQPPADNGANMPAISPWMWNSGMMLKPRSCAVKAVERATFDAEAQTLRC